MSKRWGNVINPDNVIAEFGADSLRLYEMFMGPFTQTIAWNTEGVSGVRRFLDKVWRLRSQIVPARQQGGKHGSQNTEQDLERVLHKTIKKVTEDIETCRFNTAVSHMMIFVNECEKVESISRDMYEELLMLLAPFAPHITEELWAELGNEKSIFLGSWPKYDTMLIQDELITLVVQVNGKVRDQIETQADITEEAAKEMAFSSQRVQRFVEKKEIRKVIFVKGKLINIVV